jgi:hypothetical protein
MALRLCLAILLVGGLTAPGAAHEKFTIVGTVAKVHAAQLDVKAVDGATYEIDMHDGTVVMRGLEKVAKGELRPGAKVVVHALGHDMFDLEAVEVQLVD